MLGRSVFKVNGGNEAIVEIRAATGFGRVLLYRFDDAFRGQVVGGARREGPSVGNDRLTAGEARRIAVGGLRGCGSLWSGRATPEQT